MPTTGERLPLAGVRLFATMNPVSVGGGRGVLPRSLAALFTHVRLEAPSEQETALILLHVFAESMAAGHVRFEHVGALHRFHMEVVGAVEERKLAAGGGARPSFNLRDLIKVRATVALRCVALRWEAPACGHSVPTSAEPHQPPSPGRCRCAMWWIASRATR